MVLKHRKYIYTNISKINRRNRQKNKVYSRLNFKKCNLDNWNTYVVRNDKSLMHDVIDVLYDVTDSFWSFIDGGSFTQCHA